ncbi:unnamed protein product [Cyprideis torosa]|uniref:Uncharacterized protein n=1 Tax=Cyprideis torosa TaxID=163714 RepID=A0A7R8ZVM8_9CRUS|nr:unnamed protein product [Cyprideis torosa]CAG0903150.1 unnamed protein product [Cyprideis torosa]
MRGLLKSSSEDTSQIESELQEEWHLLVRDLYAFYPLCIKYVDLQRSLWIKHPNPHAEEFYQHVAEIFNIWSKSQFFAKEELNFVSTNEIDNMTLIMPTATARRGAAGTGADPSLASAGKAKKKKKKRDDKGKGGDKGKAKASSLIVACLKRLLPVGLNLFAGREQELVQHCKDKYLKLCTVTMHICSLHHFWQREPEHLIQELAKTQLTLPDRIDPGDEMSWQHYLYSKLGQKRDVAPGQLTVATAPASKRNEVIEAVVERILAMSKVLYGLHMIDHPQQEDRERGRKVVSSQRKKAVIACFRQTSLHQLPE